MEALEKYRRELAKKTCSIKELAEMLGISQNKAYELARIEGFPVIKVGRNKLVLLSKLDEFLESIIGKELFWGEVIKWLLAIYCLDLKMLKK